METLFRGVHFHVVQSASLTDADCQQVGRVFILELMQQQQERMRRKLLGEAYEIPLGGKGVMGIRSCWGVVGYEAHCLIKMWETSGRIVHAIGIGGGQMRATSTARKVGLFWDRLCYCKRSQHAGHIDRQKNDRFSERILHAIRIGSNRMWVTAINRKPRNFPW